jgi:tRNA 5-methylaminomethyl-2-thiouridine biosynthesis bifunctional protein
MNSEFSPLLAYADIEIDANGLPTSQQYDDPYFSRNGGLEETRHVFIGGNDLPSRWANDEPFVIGETGFGTGLNFLTTWQAWEQSNGPNSGGWLHFISTELHPIRLEQLIQLHQQWPELSTYACQLQQQWPLPQRGFHRLNFPGSRISLTLLYGDANQTLPQLEAKVDAWYLDGFAPTRNEGLWNSELYQTIGRLTAAGGSFATYTAAGHVRRGLAEAGFEVSKRDGFGYKRDMSVGRKSGSQTTTPSPKNATIIGAGIAGATIARTLAERGLQVSVLEAGPEPASEASGVFAGLVRPWPELTRSPRERYFEHAFLFAQRHLSKATDWLGQSGISQAFDKPERATEIAERGFSESLLKLQEQQLCYPLGLTVNPKAWCTELLDHPNIDIRYQAKLSSIPASDSPIILAGGWRLASLSQPEHCKLQFIRGQLSTIAGAPPTTARCHNGHWLANPGKSGSVIGSSFVPNSNDCQLNPQEHAETVAKLQRDDILSSDDHHSTQSYANVRLASNDRMPIVGRLSSPNDPAVYVSTAHGSRGFTGALLAAEIIKSRLLNEPASIELDLLAAIDPKRFALRRIQKA